MKRSLASCAWLDLREEKLGRCALVDKIAVVLQKDKSRTSNAKHCLVVNRCSKYDLVNHTSISFGSALASALNTGFLLEDGEHFPVAFSLVERALLH